MYEWENYFEPHILVGIEWDIDEVADFDDIYQSYIIPESVKLSVFIQGSTVVTQNRGGF